MGLRRSRKPQGRGELREKPHGPADKNHEARRSRVTHTRPPPEAPRVLTHHAAPGQWDYARRTTAAPRTPSSAAGPAPSR
ncbi:hypothetical protein GCM10010431_58140 [Streptomyces kunmingensis]